MPSFGSAAAVGEGGRSRPAQAVPAKPQKCRLTPEPVIIGPDIQKRALQAPMMARGVRFEPTKGPQSGWLVIAPATLVALTSWPIATAVTADFWWTVMVASRPTLTSPMMAPE